MDELTWRQERVNCRFRLLIRPTTQICWRQKTARSALQTMKYCFAAVWFSVVWLVHIGCFQFGSVWRKARPNLRVDLTTEKKHTAMGFQASHKPFRTVHWRRQCSPLESVDSIVPQEAKPESRNSKFESIIHSLLASSPFKAKQITWRKDKLDICLVNNINGVECSPSMDELSEFHRTLYAHLEADPLLDQELTKLEVEVSSPGIGDVLQSDKDFVTFKV